MGGTKKEKLPLVIMPEVKAAKIERKNVRSKKEEAALFRGENLWLASKVREQKESERAEKQASQLREKLETEKMNAYSKNT